LYNNKITNVYSRTQKKIVSSKFVYNTRRFEDNRMFKDEGRSSVIWMTLV
jgi:hypothetical protein